MKNGRYLIESLKYIPKDNSARKWGARGSVVVEALCYKPEGCGIASR
jgi:hypothetical protein